MASPAGLTEGSEGAGDEGVRSRSGTDCTVDSENKGGAGGGPIRNHPEPIPYPPAPTIDRPMPRANPEALIFIVPSLAEVPSSGHGLLRRKHPESLASQSLRRRSRGHFRAAESHLKMFYRPR